MKRSFLKRTILCAAIVPLGISLFVFSDPEIQVGYSLLTADPGQQIAVATALFTYINSEGILISQAGVAATEPISSGRLFVDQDGTETAIALVNPSPQAATIDLTLRATSGKEIGRQSLPLEPQRHMAKFVSQLFPDIAAGFTGSLSFDSNQKLAAITLRQSKSSRNEVLYTTLPVVDLAQVSTSEPILFPQIAAGEGYSTQIILINPTSQTQRGRASLFGDDGKALSLRSAGVDSSQFSFEIAAHGTFRIELDSAAGLRTGYAVVLPDSGSTVPGGSAVFRYKRGGSVITEAGVAATSATTTARVFVDNAGSYTGIALANRESQLSTVNVALLDRNGLLIDTVSRILPAGGHLAAFAHELFPGLGDKFTGLIDISSTTPVAAITLKLVVNEREDLIYTTLPVADMNRPPTAATMIFPQIAFGGGFSTRLIFISTDKVRISTGQLSFFQSNSSPMSISFGNQAGSRFPYQLPEGGGTQFFPGNTARPTSLVLLDSQTNKVIREVAVTEGNKIKLLLLVLDETGTPRDDFVLSYNSLNPDVAAVDANGYVTGKERGFSTLTVSCGGVIITGTIMVAAVQPVALANSVPIPRGIVQDMARGVYLAIPQEHALMFVREPGQAPETYAGTKGNSGFRNDARLRALFRNPAFLALNQARGVMYTSDSSNNVIRLVQPGPEGKVETFAGTGETGSSDGVRTGARFNNPQGLALDNRGYLWVADSGNHTIRRINLTSGVTQTIAGKPGAAGWTDGKGDQARFNSPIGIAVEPDPAIALDPLKPISIIVADTGNGVIRRVKDTGEVETIRSGSQPGQAAEAALIRTGSEAAPIQFASPTGVAVDPFGDIYVSEPVKQRVSTILKNGDVVAAAQARTLTAPAGIAVTEGGKVIVADGRNGALSLAYGEPHVTTIRPDKIGVRGGERVTIVGSNFSPDSIVIVSDMLILASAVRDSQTIEFTAPAGLVSGLATLTVQSRGGLAQRSLLVEPPSLKDLPAGYITTIAGGTTYDRDGLGAQSVPIILPEAVTVDPAGNLLIADTTNHRVRRVDVSTGIANTIAGNGQSGFSGDNSPALVAQLWNPRGVAVDSSGNVYIADTYNQRIRKVTISSGVISTVVGTGTFGGGGDGGPASLAQLAYPRRVAVDRDNNLYVTDDTNRVRRVDATTGVITTVAGGGSADPGDNGAAILARLKTVDAIAVNDAGDLYIADGDSNRIRKVAFSTGIITTVAGTGTCCSSGDNGPATAARLGYPRGLTLDTNGNLFIADYYTHRIRKVDSATGVITTICGTSQGFSGDDGPAANAQLDYPYGLVCDAAGNLFIADNLNYRVRKVAAVSRVITTVAGNGSGRFYGDDGPASAAQLWEPSGIAVDAEGSVFIADTYNHRIRKVAASNGIITTLVGAGAGGVSGAGCFSGDGGPAASACLNYPGGIAVDSARNLFIADTGNSRIRKIRAADGVITTVAGRGPSGWGTGQYSGDGGQAQSAQLHNPYGVWIDTQNNILIADSNNARIRKVEFSTGVIDTVAGGGSVSTGEAGPATAALLQYPWKVVADGQSAFFFTEGCRVRRVDTRTGIITTVAGSGEAGFSGDGGAATAARFGTTIGIALDSAGNLLVADTFNHRIRRVETQSGIVTTVAGNGVRGTSGDHGRATAALLSEPFDIAVDAAGNLYIAETGNHRIRAIRGPIP